MKIVRTDEEIKAVKEWADERLEEEDGCYEKSEAYEFGILNMLDWLTNEEAPCPLEMDKTYNPATGRCTINDYDFNSGLILAVTPSKSISPPQPLR